MLLVMGASLGSASSRPPEVPATWPGPWLCSRVTGKSGGLILAGIAQSGRITAAVTAIFVILGFRKQS